MRFIYGRQDFKNLERGEENCYLMTNGLGGFSSLTMVGSCSRNDHALLMSCTAEEAPNHRYNMIHRLEEKLLIGEKELMLSTQKFWDDERREEGYRFLSSFVYEDYPVWHYEVEGVEIIKRIGLLPGENTVGISYEINNCSGHKVMLRVLPHLEFVPKGKKLTTDREFTFQQENVICSHGRRLYVKTDGTVTELPLYFETDLYYTYDDCDGRDANGCTAINHSVTFVIEPGQERMGEIIYSTEPTDIRSDEIFDRLVNYRENLRRRAGLQNETARALVTAANQFISYRASTDKHTILAGYPFFEDWGRDTMIALTGCCISTGQFDTAKSILQTFMKYCHKGLMPNLFPEGTQEPGYNTVDAALLFIIGVYEYVTRTEDKEFLFEAWGVMKEIIQRYREETEFHIGMDEDGLIYAGEGFDQVTWMDVRIGDILPTPRHGKPVEINAYWYNALRIMEYFSDKWRGELSAEGENYAAMAELTAKSFREKFWNQGENCLKDVLSGTEDNPADYQVRCNQIWAVSLPYSLLHREQEKQVVETVYQRLYTPLGLRTLSPGDAEFKPVYGGALLDRDLAYHQGTVWPFPLGAYYLAYLKVNDYSEQAVKRVRKQLESIIPALREGCIGQLPEIYDGERPVASKGCFAQAWSVGEILRVYEVLENLAVLHRL